VVGSVATRMAERIPGRNHGVLTDLLGVCGTAWTFPTSSAFATRNFQPAVAFVQRTLPWGVLCCPPRCHA